MTYRQLLKGNADFRRLWSGQVISEIGDWLNNIAVLALALDLAGPGHQARAIAIYAIARHLPLFLFGPLAGVVVDRADRRRVMIWADAARAALALGFLAASLFSNLWLIYAVGAGLHCVSAFFNAAKRAAIPNLTRGPAELLNANALSASTTAATIAVGSALGGLVATFISRELVFILNAVTFFASAEMIRRIRRPTQRDTGTRGRDAATRRRGDAAIRAEGGATTWEHADATLPEQAIKSDDGLASSRRVSASPRPRAPLPHLRVSSARVRGALARAATDFRAGLRYVRGERVLAAIFIVAAGWGLGNGAARALYSVFGARFGEQISWTWVERPTDFGISVLFVAMGVGGVLGAPVARRFNAAASDSLSARMGLTLLLDGCGLALFSVMPSLWSAAAVLVARELNFAIWWTAQQTIIMKRTDDRFAGRVFASYETLTTLMMLGSMYASGLAADVYGIRPVAAIAGCIIIFSGLLWFVLQRRTRAQPPASARVEPSSASDVL